MPLLSAAQITKMKTTQDVGMPDTAIIKRFTVGTATADGMGGYNTGTAEWVAVGTADARLRPIVRRGENEFVTGGQPTQILQWWVTMPLATDVLARDRVHVGTRVFEVNSVNNDESWATAIRAEVTSYGEESARE